MTHYAVLFGKRGVKQYDTKLQAIKSAKRIMNKGRYGEVDVDKITTYPKARVGMVDWSQSTVKHFSRKKR